MAPGERGMLTEDELVSTILVRVAYIYWAHGPAAEDGHPPAVALCERADAHPRKRRGVSVGTIGVPVDAAAEVRELESVAKIWSIPEQDDDPKMRREAESVLRQIEAIPRHRLT